MMRLTPPRAIVGAQKTKGASMWWGIGFGIFIYLALAVTLGVMTLRKGHWVMFILGIFLPIFWLIGAMIPPKTAAAT